MVRRDHRPDLRPDHRPDLRPDRREFERLVQQGRPVPLVREVLADLDTPLGVFLKLDDGESSFLFESVEGGERWSRFSVIGIGSRATLRARGATVEIVRGQERTSHVLASDRSEDPLEYLRRLLESLAPANLDDAPRFFPGGAVGYLSYDWVRYVEKLPDENPDPLSVPDAYFTFPEVVLVHDRQRQQLSIMTFAECGEDGDAEREYARAAARIDQVVERLEGPVPATQERPSPEPVETEANLDLGAYADVVKRCREYIQAGDIFQVVPSRRVRLPLQCDPIEIYRQLRVINPSPYLFFLRAGDHIAVGSSPEILVRLEDDEITLRPIAGTYARGKNEEEDRAREEALLADPKELAEHIMLVDLARNDAGRVSEIGSVRVDELKVIERYSHVLHIVSNVKGRLRADADAVDLLRATFPAGTLSGAPKVRAMEIIEELEPERRGLYGGAVGYIDHRGNMDMCIAIRTLLIKDGTLYAQAGAGVVADSDPEREFQETDQKLGAVLRAIEAAGGGLPS